MTLSIIPLLFVKNKAIKSVPKKINIPINKRIISGIIAISLVIIFNFINRLTTESNFSIQGKLSEIFSETIPTSMWPAFQSPFVLLSGLFLIFLWTYYNNSRYIKIIIGSFFALLAFVFLYLIPAQPEEYHITLFLFFFMFIALGEMYISPIIYSMVSEYTNPKYLTIALSLAYVPHRILFYFLEPFFGQNADQPSRSLEIAILLIFILFVSVLVYYITNRKSILWNPSDLQA